MSRPQVPQGVRLREPPEGCDEEAYWTRTRELRGTGMPWWNASVVAAQEATGARPVRDGPLARAEHAPLEQRPTSERSSKRD